MKAFDGIRRSDLQTAAEVLLALALAGLLAIAGPGSAKAQEAPRGSDVAILHSDATSLEIALTVASFDTETVEHDGEAYQRVLIPGMEQTATPGAPQVPSRGILLGLPTANNISLDVLESACTTLSPYRLSPAPELILENAGLDVWTTAGQVLERVSADGALYQSDSYWPGAFARLAETGSLREQRVGQIQFYPVQFNPVRQEIRICRRITAKLSWPAENLAAANATGSTNPAFDAILRQTLLNYKTLPPREEPATENLGPTASDTDSEQSLPDAASPQLKIGVSQEGIYKITYADLANAGLDPESLDPRRLGMISGGKRIPILVQGESDGRFDSTDFILFYGQGIHDSFTKVNVYWLSMGLGPGLRMAVRDGHPIAATVPPYFPVLKHAEEDTAYWQTMPSFTGEDRWFWGSRLSPNTAGLATSRDYTVHLGSLSPALPAATLRVRLKGYTGLAHRTRIQVNGNMVDEQAWQGQVEFDHLVTIPRTLLRDGDNTVRVEALFASAPVDQLLVNWIEVGYWNSYAAEGDQLAFGTPLEGLQRFEIQGFGNPSLTLLDVTDPGTPVSIVNTDVRAQGNGYTLAFADTARSSSRYFVSSSARFLSPVSVTADQPSSWKSPANGADYIIVTYDDFYDSALALAAQRRASGLRVATVKVTDLYDEFNYGVFNPGAIRDFLRYAYASWAKPAPTYVLLLGDASQDYKENRQDGTHNYVPSHNMDSDLFGEVSSDNWFVTVSGSDELPDMLIGRLPAQSREEASIMVAKTIDYERRPPDPAWNTTTLFVADDDEPDFARVSDLLASHLPYYYSPRRVYAANYPPGDPRADIINQINAGTVLATYVGHGEYFAWGRWNGNSSFMFHVSDLPALKNADRLPVVVVGDCLNGFFAGPKDNTSLAEGFLRKQNGGAVAVWAPTELGYPTGHRILLDELYTALFDHDQLALGAATTAAKIATYGQSTGWGELIATYVLLGDPATELRIPPNYPYVVSTEPANGSSNIPFDKPIQVRFSKPMDPNTVSLSEPTASAFTASWNADFTVLTAHHPVFRPSTRYAITVRGGDRRGNQLGPGTVPKGWTFTTATDSIPPDVVIALSGQLSSADGISPVTLRFSEPVRPESASYSIAPLVPGALTWAKDGRSALFTHQRFLAGETYTFTLLTATDIAGNDLDKPISFSFPVLDTLYIYLPRVVR